MKTTIHYFKDLYSGPFQAALVFSFILVTAITIGTGAWVISSTIDNYLAEAIDDRIARDMHLAKTLYEIKLRQISGIASRLALHNHVIDQIDAADHGDAAALATIDDEISNKSLGVILGGNHFLAVLNTKGDVLVGRLISPTGEQLVTTSSGNWYDLPIVRTAMEQKSEISATEILPGELLSQVGLADQAYIKLIDTPNANETLFDPREGTAGLAITSVVPIIGPGGRVSGLALVFHMFNNDFALVDRIRDAAQIDSATIFMGDLRISTNVPIPADGQRAVGTRLSKEVGDIVLYEGREYVGTAFVVNENYITRYTPLEDHAGKVVGALYVGTPQGSFSRLLSTVHQRIALVAMLTLVLTFILATPVSRRITRPLKELRELSATSQRVAEGDLSARAPVTASGEVGLLASSFNSMLDTLQTTQEQLLQSEKLASLGQLAAGVAHELNNPLTSILLFSEILLANSDLESQHHSDIEAIVRQTNRCRNIVAGLLDFARQHQVNVQELDLNNLIQRTIMTQEKHKIYAKAEIVTDLDPNLPLIQADPDQVQAVLINLMSNAAEAMPDGGTLSLKTRPGPPDMVTVEIRDIGIGIPKENLAKLFTPFFTTKSTGKGIGLGLAIAYGIVKMHRGQISVESEQGSGTTFTFSLPIRLPSLFGPETNAKPPQPGADNTIG